MAGIGFELKRMYAKDGLVNKIKAFTYSSLVTIGPMLTCMLLVVAVQWMQLRYEVSFVDRELFQASIVYAFIFSYIISNVLTLYLTRSVSDFIYQKKYEAVLPSFYGSLKIGLLLGAVPALLFLGFSPLSLTYKASLLLLFMTLIVIWFEVVYLSAMKNYRRIGLSFLGGALLAIGLSWVLLKYAGLKDAGTVLLAVDAGFMLTAAALLVQIERFFRLPTRQSDYTFLAYLTRYPSLILIGALTAIGLYSHQFVQWLGDSGVVVADAFLMSPSYDLAVYYAFMSAIPSLIMFVVSLETNLYPKYRHYYDLVLHGGSLGDINRARGQMFQVLTQQISLLMGVQLFFSIISVALGIRFLPLVGFSASQIELYNILVIGFFAYIIYTVVTLVLLYFDDRKGVLWLAVLFLACNTGFAVVSVLYDSQGFSFFAAAFLSLVAALGRLMHVLNHINYYTFSAQPVIHREKTNRFSKLLHAAPKRMSRLD
ncbi:exopolysaccharide Pel transporter PelG [Paenibacillus sp. MMS18-CY102]|uniref:exopolysaccharide Pel transporter PelG n=1 Tax=Paenibacillus sp. MMS18-CY102 TaxID=2682849 RepID=UPI0013665A53|nr:exopolysaccharide Pel transporter PelG [Paenibacillus sp. MMS18-CY102]MWC30043.1 exopolysaccharide Pel transporter PelG [Paenibacillus sp. MMS18-CY102]